MGAARRAAAAAATAAVVVAVVVAVAVAAAPAAGGAARVLRVPAERGALAEALANVSATTDDVEVVLASGTHQLGATLVVVGGGGGGGGAARRVAVRAEERRGATVSGGAAVVGWAEAASGAGACALGAWVAPLPASFDAASLSGRLQAWRGSARLAAARSPTMRYAALGADMRTVTYAPGQVPDGGFKAQGSVLVGVYERWTLSLHPLQAVNATSRTLLLETPAGRWASGPATGQRYFVSNALEELDAEGEFWVDAETRRVLLCSASRPDDGEVVLAQPGLVELLAARGTAAAPVAGAWAWTGVRFAHAAVETEGCLAGSCDGQSANFLTTAAVHITHAAGWSFEDCEVSAVGGYAVWFDAGSHGASLRRSLVNDTGAGGVRVGGASQDAGDVPSGCAITDSVVTHGGALYEMGAGVLAQITRDLEIGHNEVGFHRYTGVSTGWVWGYGPSATANVSTHHNHIHHIGQGALSDMACVYTLGHQAGSVVSHNLCEEVESFDYGGWGYYADEGSRGEAFVSNIAVNTKCAGFHQHYGTDNVITNNLLVDTNAGGCDAAVKDSRHHAPAGCRPGAAQAEGCCCWAGCDMGVCSSFNFSLNVVVDTPVGAARRRARGGGGASDALLGQSAGQPLRNDTFARNVWFSPGAGKARSAASPLWNATVSSDGAAAPRHGEPLAAWPGAAASSVWADPLLDRAALRLAEGSPALKKGFKNIDAAAVGPRPGPDSAPSLP